MDSPENSRSWRMPLTILSVLIGILVVLELMDQWEVGRSNLARQDSTTMDTAIETDPLQMSTPFLMDGVRSPTILTADESSLDDDAPVVGVCVNDQCRAYSVTVLSSMMTCVVNDLITSEGHEPYPATVTYCVRTDRVRVLTAPDNTGEPLTLGLAGWRNGQMMIMIDDEYHSMPSEELPFDDVEFVRTTWGEWKTLHPGTGVYEGFIAPAESNENESLVGQRPEDLESTSEPASNEDGQ